jgi:hypothetical protein
MTSTRTWLSVAVGAPEPSATRDAEFRTQVRDPAELLATFDRLAGECAQLGHRGRHRLGRYAHADPEPRLRAGNDHRRMDTAAALEHLREHVAHLQHPPALGRPSCGE